MSNDSTNNVDCVESSRGRKRKSRWSDAARPKTFIPGMPTVLPNTFTPQQQEIYVLQLQVEELSRQLRSGEVTIPEERSPSPEPIYDLHGKRLNTRTHRAREKIKAQRHRLIQQLQSKNPCFKPPSDYKPPVDICSEKVFIPQEEYSNVNFIGLIIGPRGNTLKAIEKDTGAKVIIRGKNSALSSKVKTTVAADEPLHAYVTANTSDSVMKAVSSIQKIIEQGINEPNLSNQLRRQQLLQLAQINGTVRQPCMRQSWANTMSSVVCLACGAGGHVTSDCRSSNQHQSPDKKQSSVDNVLPEYDQSYMDFLAEISEISSGAKNCPSGIQAQKNESSVYKLAQDQSTADILHQADSLTQQTVCSPYPSSKTSTNQFISSATSATLLANYTDPLSTYNPQSTASSASKVSGTTNKCLVPVSSYNEQQLPSETSTSAFMDLAHEHFNYWANMPPSISEYGVDCANYLNLGLWGTENLALYGSYLPPPRYTPPEKP